MCFVSTDTLKSLSPDELGMLLFLVNTHKPRLMSYELTAMDLRLIHGWKFKEILGKSEPTLTDDAKPVFKSLVEKLGLV